MFGGVLNADRDHTVHRTECMSVPIHAHAEESRMPKNCASRIITHAGRSPSRHRASGCLKTNRTTCAGPKPSGTEANIVKRKGSEKSSKFCGNGIERARSAAAVRS